ncbi:unnamed protein product [Oreochromis niloticus]|nr:unnamed protein product [Mustela putorius furo]
MTAADVSRTRRLAAVRKDKGLFFTIFSLLFLLYVANLLTSQTSKEREKEEAEDREMAGYEHMKKKASREYDEKLKHIHPILELIKSSSLADDFPPLLEMATSLNRFYERSKIMFDRQKDCFAANTKVNEKELEELQNILNILDEFL